MRLIAALIVSFALTGCLADLDLFGNAIPQIPQVPPGEEVVEMNGETIIEPIPTPPTCQARARYFHGTVSVPCEEIGRAIAP